MNVPTTVQAVNQASGHWYECSECNHVGTGETLPELIKERHSHYRETHPDKWHML